MGDDGADIAGEEVFLLAHAEDERATAPGAHEEVRNVSMNESDSIRADDLSQSRANGVDEKSFLVKWRGRGVTVGTRISSLDDRGFVKFAD